MALTNEEHWHLSVVVSKEDHNRNLSRIWIEPGYAVATDGHRLHLVRDESITDVGWLLPLQKKPRKSIMDQRVGEGMGGMHIMPKDINTEFPDWKPVVPAVSRAERELWTPPDIEKMAWVAKIKTPMDAVYWTEHFLLPISGLSRDPSDFCPGGVGASGVYVYQAVDFVRGGKAFAALKPEEQDPEGEQQDPEDGDRPLVVDPLAPIVVCAADRRREAVVMPWRIL